jgi:hypothetical protein
MQKPVGAVNVPSKAQEELVPREEAALEVVLARIRRCFQGLQQEEGQQRRRSFIALHNELFPAGAKVCHALMVIGSGGLVILMRRSTLPMTERSYGVGSL